MTDQSVTAGERLNTASSGVRAALLPTLPLGPERVLVRDLLVAGAGLFIVTLIAYLATIDWRGAIPRDGTSLAVGRDFLNFWMYGRAAGSADPGRFYDLAAYHRALTDLFGIEFPGQNWSYPPSVMLLAAPFARLDYLPALALWTLLGLVVFVAVASRHVQDRRILIPVMLSPAALFCLVSGQSSFLTAAAMIAAFVWLDRRPMLAGILIGLLTIKPQLGILFPFMLAASGRWRVFWAAGVTTVLIVGITAVLFGPKAWADFITSGLPAQGLVLADPDRIATPFYPTIFMNLRGTGLGYAASMSVQAMFSLAALAAVIWAFHARKNADSGLLFALFLAASATASPYFLAYDLLPLTFAAVVLLLKAPLDPTGRRLVQLAYFAPALQLALGTYHLPGPALIAPCLVVYLLTRLTRPEAISARG
jgi:Glycosyltransferase family 87